MLLEFDPEKDAINLGKHFLSLQLAENFDWDMADIREDTRYDYGEQRFKAIGFIGERVYSLIYCLRGDAVRAISLRKADRKEVKDYVRYIEGR